MHLIDTQNLCKKYADITALDSLSLQLNPGEIVGLLGPNGAGKTTAIHILLGLLTPSSGTASVLGLSPIKHREKIAERINFSSAYVQLPSNLKVSENLTVFSKLYSLAAAGKKMKELVEIFDIGDLLKRITGSLSAGEKTRLNLVKCLLNEPKLLLLDEPTASLDPEMADTVRKTLKKIQSQNQMGILYTSHNMQEVEEVCNRIIFIHEGKTVAQGTTSEVKKAFHSPNLEEVFIKIVRKGDFVIGEKS